MNPAPVDVPDALGDLLEARCGAAIAWHRLGGTSSQVWRRTGATAQCVVKRHRSHRASRQVVDAHARVGDAPWCARLIAASPPWVAFEWIVGEPVGPGDVEAVGAVLAQLRRIDWPDDDPVGVGEAIRLRIERLVARAVEPTHRSASDLLQSRAAAVDWGRVRRVACHRDPRPDNWLRTDAGLVLLDFEHARLDVDGTDEAALWCAGAVDDATSLGALERGTGRPPLHITGFDVLAGLRAVGTAIRHAEGGDVPDAPAAERRLRLWIERFASV